MRKTLMISVLLLSIFVACRADDRFVLIDVSPKKGNDVSVPENSYYISKYKVTVKEWKEYISVNRLKFNWDYYLDENNLSVNDDSYPMTSLTWLDAIMFCNWKSENEKRRPVYQFKKINYDFSWAYSQDSIMPIVKIDKNANGYRLPTEIEWEFAAKGGEVGMKNKWWKNVDIRSIGWFHENTNKLQKVAQLNQNPLGLYDVIGNAYEWVWTDPNRSLEGFLKNTESELFVCKGGAYYMSLVEPPSYQKGNTLVHEKEVPNFFIYRKINPPLMRMAGLRLCYSK